MANLSGNSLNDEKQHAIVIAIGFLKTIVRVLFPSYVLFQMNNQLNRVNRFYKNPWFSKQVRLNWIVILILSTLFLGPLTLGYLAITGNKNVKHKLDAGKVAFSSHEFKKTFAYISSAATDDTFVLEVKLFGGLALFGMIFGNIIIFMSHDLVRDSKKLIKILRNEGVINKEDKNPTVLYTPIGVLIDLAGSPPKEVAANERIWMAMNIEVKDWAEAPEKRSLVFFKTTFKLKARYDFVFEKKK